MTESLVDCPIVAVPGLLADGQTIDGNGIRWTCEQLSGWWDSTALRSGSEEIQPVGEVITVAHEGGRPLVYQLTAAHTDRATPLGKVLCHAAMETAKAAFRAVYVPVLMEVTDPFQTLQALVMRVAPLRSSILGQCAAVRFPVPLLAEDPRRYSPTETTEVISISGSTPSIDHTFNVLGVVETPFVLVIVHSTNPKLLSHSLGPDVTHRPFVQWNGSVAGTDVLEIDMGAGTVLLNGVDARGGIEPGSQFFHLLAGSNYLTYSRSAGGVSTSATLKYHAAYD